MHVVKVILLSLLVTLVQTADRKWPPGVLDGAAVPADSRPLSPDEALKRFHLAPGYRVEVVASEPLVQDPVAIDWDTEGRLWVVEMPAYMLDIAARDEHDPIGRIVVLEDRDGDGKMDTRTVFAERLVMARAVKVLDRGVLVGEPPHVWLMRDTNGDLRADTKEPVTDAYGRVEVDPQNNANALDWSLDNWMHMAGQVDIALRLKDGKFEVRRTLRRGQWGVTHDDTGRIYRNSNESALHVDVVPSAYLARNPNLLRTRGSYERLADENPELNTVWPVRKTPGLNRAYQFGILREDGSLARFTAVCSPLVYRGDRLPSELYGNVFVAEPAANAVSRIIVDDSDGKMPRARKAYERGEFLASTDERFRPVYLANAPDGTLTIVDMYRGILEHRLSMTEYLRDQIIARRLEQPTGLGRIYRVMHETTKRDTSPPLTKSPAELVAALSHPNGWWRDTAQRLIVERFGGPATAARTDDAPSREGGAGSGKSTVPPRTRPELEAATSEASPRKAATTSTELVTALVALAERAPEWRTRLHALWTLEGIDALTPPAVLRALEDSSADVRAAAVRLAEQWLADEAHPLSQGVLKRVDDASWAVRRQLAASLGAMGESARAAAAVRALEKYGDDPITVDAALSGLRGREMVVLDQLLRDGPPPSSQAAQVTQTPQREAAIAMLAATIVRGGEEEAVQALFARLGDGRRAPWQRAALVRGGEIALLGATMPGTPAPTAANPAAPCPTCPGGRAGPGGAYAYARPASAAPAGRAAASLRLNREPVALTSMGASAATDLERRVSRMLVRVSWPGKAGEPAPIAPLTAEEQQRFERGRDVYRTFCQQCHQPDGRGQDKLAPTLIESPLALAAPEVPVRVLLHGKEGAVGLMPPIGSALNDDQIASVLTYVRREWGQAGSPVDAAAVAAVRTKTANRTRPWTDAELRALAGQK
jgi:mono/diheme cytochrome c family protein/glucose/arabinose dehydrogenase